MTSQDSIASSTDSSSHDVVSRGLLGHPFLNSNWRLSVASFPCDPQKTGRFWLFCVVMKVVVLTVTCTVVVKVQFTPDEEKKEIVQCREQSQLQVFERGN